MTAYRGFFVGIKAIAKNKQELLLVLDRSKLSYFLCTISLSESDIRDYVKKQKINGSTR